MLETTLTLEPPTSDDAIGDPAPDTAAAQRAPDSDDELLRAAQSGDASAAAAFVARHEGLIRLIARELAPDRSQADDVAQECRVHLLRVLSRYDRTRPLRPWLHTVLRNCARNYGRTARRWRAVRLPEDAPEPASDGPRPEEHAGGAERAERLRRAVAGLPELYRGVVVRRYFREEPCESIARALRMPVGTVKNRLFRARALLAAKLAPA